MANNGAMNCFPGSGAPMTGELFKYNGAPKGIT